MSFRIYKALTCIIMDDSLQKKVLERRWSTRLFNTPFAGMSVLLKTLFLFDFDNHSSLFIQLLHTYML